MGSSRAVMLKWHWRRLQTRGKRSAAHLMQDLSRLWCQCWDGCLHQGVTASLSLHLETYQLLSGSVLHETRAMTRAAWTVNGNPCGRGQHLSDIWKFNVKNLSGQAFATHTKDSSRRRKQWRPRQGWQDLRVTCQWLHNWATEREHNTISGWKGETGTSVWFRVQPQVQMWNTVTIKILWPLTPPPALPSELYALHRLSHPVITFVWTHMIKMTIKYLYS